MKVKINKSTKLPIIIVGAREFDAIKYEAVSTYRIPLHKGKKMLPEQGYQIGEDRLMFPMEKPTSFTFKKRFSHKTCERRVRNMEFTREDRFNPEIIINLY